MNVKKIALAKTGGIITSFVEILITIILTETIGLNSRISYAISLILGSLVLFHFHRHLTFKVKNNKIKQLTKFSTAYGIICIANWLLVLIITSFINYVYAIIIVSTILWPINYLLNDKWVFRNKTKKLFKNNRQIKTPNSILITGKNQHKKNKKVLTN